MQVLLLKLVATDFSMAGNSVPKLVADIATCGY